LLSTGILSTTALADAPSNNLTLRVGVPFSNATDIYPKRQHRADARAVGRPTSGARCRSPPSTTFYDQIERGGPKPGQRYSATKRAQGDRAAWRVVPNHCPTLTEERARAVISTWLKIVMIESRNYEDSILRRDRAGAFVVKRPGGRMRNKDFSSVAQWRTSRVRHYRLRPNGKSV
jgi:hypothetical protein